MNRRYLYPIIEIGSVFIMLLMLSLGCMVQAAPTGPAVSSLRQQSIQYRRYVQTVAPLLAAAHSAEGMLSRPETLTLQRWSAWLSGWDAQYERILSQTNQAQQTTITRYDSYQQLVATHTVLHQVQQRMQRYYLGLPTQKNEMESVLEAAQSQVQTCLAIETTLQPLLVSRSFSNASGRH